MSNLRVFALLVALAPFSCSPPADPVQPVASAEPTVAPSVAPTAAPSASAEAEFPIRTMFVSEEIVDCEGEGPRKCMRTRASEDDEWELFYDSIEGFEHEAGFAYELRVEARPVGRPPADASSVTYKLIEVVSKKKVEPAP